MPTSSSFSFLACVAALTIALVSPACTQEAAAPGAGAAAFIVGVTGTGQPDEAALENLQASDYAAVIDLRMPDENRGLADERASVEGLGMSYIPLPINGGADITYENANALDDLIAQFDGPVLVHCGSGNRAGALLALRASINGADEETAVEAGIETGLTRLEDVVRQRLQAR